MQKLFTIIIFLVITIVIFCVVNAVVGTMQQDKDPQTNSIKKDKEVEVFEIPSFLKNTTYIYNNRIDGRPVLIDLSYTPRQEFKLNNIQIKIKDNLAIVKTDEVIIHKIYSAIFYSISDETYNSRKLAILKTDRGEIRLAEEGISYSCTIKYGNYIAYSGFLSAEHNCRLPSEYKQ